MKNEPLNRKLEYTRVARVKRKTVGVTLPPELIQKARKHGLNLSRILEQALSDVINHLESVSLEKGGFGTVGSEWRARRELNPGPTG